MAPSTITSATSSALNTLATAGGRLDVVQRLDGAESSVDEVVLFDADAASKLHPYFSVGSVVHSRSHRLLAHAVDTKGSEYYDIAFLEIDPGSTSGSGAPSGAAPSHAALPDLIQNTSGALVFADDSIVFYTAVDDNHRPSKVYRHQLGTPQSEDVLIYEEPDPGFFVGVDTTEDDLHIVITSHDHVTSEQRLIDYPDSPDGAPADRRSSARHRVQRQLARRASVAAHQRRRSATSSWPLRPLDNPSPSEWVDLVPHRPGRLIVAVTTFARHIVRLEREGGLPRIVVQSRDDGQEHVIEFDEQAYSLGLAPGYEYDTTVLRFTYSSLTTPQQTFDYDMVTHERVLVDQRVIPSGHDPKRYRTARVFAPSHDGALVPVSLLWHESTDPASAPLYLYGYGSYGHTVAAGFSSNTLSLVNRGFVYAIAHVRGGKDKGYAWYESGKLMHKKNTFSRLRARRRAPAARPATGRPATSAFTAAAPAACWSVPPSTYVRTCSRRWSVRCRFVDVLNTMCDAELPLTPPEWPEWGNPIESADAYRYIASYSPYDNVEAKAYPHILATAGLTDPRVTYWEPAKWVARLRDSRPTIDLLLLRTYMEAGHAGAAGRFEKLHQVALVQAFVLLANDAIDRPTFSAR